MEGRRVACCVLLVACCWLDLRGEGCSKISSNLYPSPQLYVAPAYGFQVRGRCTSWCIHLARLAKSGQNCLKMGTIIIFEQAKWFKIFFGAVHLY